MPRSKIEFGEFRLSNKSKEYLEKVLNSNWLSQGTYVKLFEQKFADLLGSKYCKLVSSGTLANLCSCLALYEINSKPGDGGEIITSALSFIATATPVFLAGFRPIFCDVGRDLQIDVSQIERLVTHKTRAIIAPNLMGKPCKMEIVREICDKYNLVYIADLCEAYPSVRKGKNALSYADFATTSHFVAHIVMTGFEGGTVLTQDKSYDALIQAIRNHGRFGDDPFFNHVVLSTNAKSSDVAAAIALGELDSFEENIKIRRKNIDFFNKSFENYKDLFWSVEEEEGDFNAPHGYSFVFHKEEHSKLFKKRMDEASIHVKLNFGTIPNHKCFRFLDYDVNAFPMANKCGSGWHIGCHKYLTDDDLDYIKDKVTSCFEEMRKI